MSLNSILSSSRHALIALVAILTAASLVTAAEETGKLYELRIDDSYNELSEGPAVLPRAEEIVVPAAEQ